eukprot:177348-Pyramimonas_sp.AAC.1
MTHRETVRHYPRNCTPLPVGIHRQGHGSRARLPPIPPPPKHESVLLRGAVHANAVETKRDTALEVSHVDLVAWTPLAAIIHIL